MELNSNCISLSDEGYVFAFMSHSEPLYISFEGCGILNYISKAVYLLVCVNAPGIKHVQTCVTKTFPLKCPGIYLMLVSIILSDPWQQNSNAVLLLGEFPIPTYPPF